MTTNAKAENPPENIPDELRDQMKGAGVEHKDVGWRIRAGLSRDQAIAAAKQEKFEREVEAYAEKNKGKSDDDLREIADDFGMQPEHHASRNQLIILILQSGKADAEGKSKKAEGRTEVNGDLEEMKVPELRLLAAQLGIEGTSTMTKAEIIDAIEAKEKS